MLWIKSFHLIFVVTWFAGLFYLPRLFVYHAMADDRAGIERFKIMERKLYRGIMTPSAVLAVVMGIGLVAELGFEWATTTIWFQLKVFLVLLLIVYHGYLGHLVKVFREERNERSHVYYRWINELPVVILVGVVLLAVIKPGG